MIEEEKAHRKILNHENKDKIYRLKKRLNVSTDRTREKRRKMLNDEKEDKI